MGIESPKLPMATRPRKTRVAFICVHNSCRSQIAEALCGHLAGGVIDAYSAGTEIRPHIDRDAVRLMRHMYDIDMEKTQCPKLMTDIPTVDIAVRMGCDVRCPFLPCEHSEDWGIDDPAGKSDEEFIKIIRQIEKRIMDLKERLDQ
ncbi:MAG: hypothetical protein FWH45_00295 [Methanomassiliicoccaceae archaeon]|nr:hypothetical protein [Methanomassiliicoccaceae archaeon]MCL2145615.1 hypothetical protein [Methanomassiliicoccaceae archaeon]